MIHVGAAAKDGLCPWTPSAFEKADENFVFVLGFVPRSLFMNINIKESDPYLRY